MTEVLDLNYEELNKKKEILLTIILALISFITPTFLASVIPVHSQLIVGSIVNAMIIISALKIKGFKNIFVITMPSISTIMSGYIFKTASIYMIYMIPFIWLGNFLLLYLYKFLFLKKEKNYFLTGIISILLKVLVIFIGFLILKSFNIFPSKTVNVLEAAMSITQIYTAFIGMLVAYIILILTRYKNVN